MESPLKDIHNKKIFKLICGQFGSREEIQIISLFMLNKIPGKPSNCRNCEKLNSKNHLIECNKTIRNTVIDKLYSFKEIRNNMLKITDFFTSPNVWPFWLIKLFTMCSKKEDKKIICTELA